MSSIDQVIAAARRGGGFTERKTFKLARKRAIEKMRKFALADPYFYILELIQAAVAHHAQAVDLRFEDGDATISYIGPNHMREDELGQLFDFLFASKDRLDLAHLRSLALGINAALRFEPRRIVIESGDGTPAGTSRMVLEQGADSVDVGRADHALGGTYIRMEGLNRRKVGRETGRSGDDEGSGEHSVIESRCLAAPVPIVFNQLPIFGFGRQRIPGIVGYDQALGFDEGDLYGILGRRPIGFKPSFQVLTYGVWVQTYAHELWPGERIGGIVCFDRLRKTADHSGFVKDERFEEMWIRLRPYCEEMITGVRKVVHLGVSASGEALDLAGLREFLHAHPRVVVVPSDLQPGSMAEARAESVSSALDAELLKLDGVDRGRLSALAGPDTVIYYPELHDWADVTLYAQAPDEEPGRPWLAAPVDLPDHDLPELFRRVLGEAADPVLDALGRRGPVKARLYAPRPEETSGADLQVRLRVSGRELMRASFASATPGHVLVVDLGDVVPSPLRAPVEGFDAPVGLLVAEHFADLAAPALAESSDRLLQGLAVGELDPGSPAARLAVAAMVHLCLPRFQRGRDGGPRLVLSASREVPGLEPVELPLLRLLDGQGCSLRRLAEMINEQGGVFYGVVEGVQADLEGLDRGRILELDLQLEGALRALFGDSTYVRVDRRDVLASHGSLVVRDVATGLHPEPDFPLPVEARGGGDVVAVLQGLEAEAREEAIADLVSQLRDVWRDPSEVALGPDAAPGGEVGVGTERAEASRQAGRILQRFLAERVAAGHTTGLYQLEREPLFATVAGTRHTLEQLPPELEIAFGDEWSVPADAASAAALPDALLLSGWGASQLARVRRLEPAFGFHLDDDEALADERTPAAAFLAELTLDGQEGAARMSGVLGIPAVLVGRPAIQLRDASGRCVSTLKAWGAAYGAVGSLRVARAWDAEVAQAVAEELDRSMGALMEALVAAVPGLAPGSEPQRRALEILLGVVGRELSLQEGPDGLVRPEVRRPAAQRILAAPLFPGRAGGYLSGWQLVHGYCRLCVVEPGARPWATWLSAETDPALLAWLDTHLCAARIGRQAGRLPPAVPVQDLRSWEGELNDTVLAYNVEQWMERLRPDRGSGVEFAVSIKAPRRGDPPIRARPDRTWRGFVYDRIWQRGLTPPYTVRVDPAHPLVELARVRAAEDPRWLAWLLLACYAELNTRLVPIGNQHEAAFQLAVGKALRDGELRAVRPNVPLSGR